MEEIWRDIPGYEGRYEVSSRGRVRSLDTTITRSNGRSLRVHGRILRPALHEKNRYRLALPIEGCSNRSFYVSNLVAAAFIGPKPAGCEVCHNDGNRLNDCAENLRYDTPKRNAADRKGHGTHLVGEAVPSAKLSERDVLAIRAAFARGARAADLAGQFDVGANAIRRAALGITWGHL